MIFFITFLRALAACLITNSHYTGVYPTDIIAKGGLLGDIIFFAVSGYCLLNVKQNFPKWYGKRLWRVYLPMFIATAIYFLLGQYDFNSNGFLWWFVYPTYYHFIASIVILYIPFYFIGRYDFLKKKIPLIAGIIGIIYLLVYIFFYDKSYYHIDTVREWMIRFLFFESMLLGGYFKYNDNKFRNKFHWSLPFITMLLFFGYFTSKFLFSKYNSLAPLQIVNQIIIFVLLFFLFWLFASLDKMLEKLPKWMRKCIGFIASITLEIYLVQYVLIAVLREYLIFPINWIVITASILLAATTLHFICKLIYWLVEKLIFFLKNKSRKKEAKV